MKLFLFSACLLVSVHGQSQKLELIPHLGFQYSGISYISRTDKKPEDLKISHPELDGIIGADISYRKKRIIHNLSFQLLNLGHSVGIINLYADKGILPYFQEEGTSESTDILFFSYHVQKESKVFLKFIAKSNFKYFYSIGAGIGFNKTKKYYDLLYKDPNTYGFIYGEQYYADTIFTYRARSAGIFLSGKWGINFYNKKNNHFLTLEFFFNKGFTKLQDIFVNYDYGFTTYPQYQRSIKNVHLKTRGTVFGYTLGVPINLLRK